MTANILSNSDLFFVGSMSLFIRSLFTEAVQEEMKVFRNGKKFRNFNEFY
jgi:hypothetical protein